MHKKLEELKRLYAESALVFGMGQAADKWLHSPCSALRGKRPVDAMLDVGGFDRVYSILRGMRGKQSGEMPNDHENSARY